MRYIIPLLLFFMPTLIFSEGKDVYLSQTFIDTMVQSAYYGFTSASGGNIEYSQSQAISRAKKIARRLKKLAENDPNKRYILWRVGELEQQIYLEEEEAYLKEKYKRQKAVNELVAKFNSETKKWRPSFANLVAIQERMLELQPSKANELADLIKERDKNISREVVYFIRKALNEKNYNKAKKEFDYLSKNRKYLYVSGANYALFQKKLRAKENADDILDNIAKYKASITDAVSQHNLTEARRRIEIFKNQLVGSKNYLPPKSYSTYYLLSAKMSHRISEIEDSLVATNISILKRKGVDPAIDFMDNTLRVYGVSNDKIAYVNKEIMAVPGTHKESQAERAITNELSSFEKHNSNNGMFTMADIHARAMEKADSIKAVANEEYARTHKKEIAKKKKQEKALDKKRAKASKISKKIYALLDLGKRKKAVTLFSKKEAVLKEGLTNKGFKMLTTELNTVDFQKNSYAYVTNSRSSIQKGKTGSISAYEKYDAGTVSNSEQATREIMKIYTLIDENRVREAYELFTRKEKLLQKYSGADVFLVLKDTVLNSYNSMARTN